MTTIAVVTGNPKPQSRTHSVARAVADAIAAELGLARDASGPSGPRDASGPSGPSRLEIDLAEYAVGLFDWSDPALTRLTAQVAASDIAIFASPTYKAAYTGMLKAFLDRYGSNGLAGVVAVPVMTGGWPGHLLAVEVHLRPVLVELAATVPSRGLYVTEPEFADLDAAVGKWSAAAIPLITAALQNLSERPRSFAPRQSCAKRGPRQTTRPPHPRQRRPDHLGVPRPPGAPETAPGHPGQRSAGMISSP